MKRIQQWKYAQIRGYLTVYMALSLTAMLSLVMVLVKGIQQNSAREAAEFAMDTAMQSVLAEYHRELWEQYDLLFVDLSYGSASPDKANTEEHLRRYLDANLPRTPLLQMKTRETGIQELSLATDACGDVFRGQILSYMREMTGLTDAARLLLPYKQLQQGGYASYEAEAQRLRNEAELEDHPTPVKKTQKPVMDPETGGVILEDAEEEVPVDNPASQVNQLRNIGILQLVCEHPETLSHAAVSTEDLPSFRELQEGSGVSPDREKQEEGALSADLVSEEGLYQGYLFQKCGWYGQELDKAVLKYQLEYILAGRESDQDNLESAVSRILLLRESANAAYLFSDAAKMAEVKAMAAGVAAVAVAPELEPLLEISITFAWAYLESLQDVRGLLEGGAVPLVKTAVNWQTGLQSILHPDAVTTAKGTAGLKYRDYLFLLLSMEDRDTKLFRTMDVVEMDIRMTAGNESFRLDGCADSFLAAADTITGTGYSCTITRRYGYP